MKLYTNDWSRGVTVEWYIAEIGIDVEKVNVDMYGTKEHKSDAFRKINPMGRVPAFQDGDLTMSESGAILLYLWEEKSSGRDKLTAAQRGRILQQVLFANSTLEEAAFGPHKDKQLPEVMGALDQLLATQPYVAGPEFTVADVAVASTLTWLPSMVPEAKTDGYKHISEFMKRVHARPACKATLLKAMAKGPAA